MLASTGQLAAARTALLGTLSFRLRPAVLNVPAPNRNGRDVNVLRHATDVALGARFGLGNRLELTGLLPAGLYQRGAGIKGITDQSAPPVAVASLHDPRVGFAYSLNTGTQRLGAKVRLEAKLPLGDTEALAGEPSFVASPSLALSSEQHGFFAGLELGVRLRRPTELFGVRLGSQAVIAAGAGYEIKRLGLAFATELYLLPSLVRRGTLSYLPAEWLASTQFRPGASRALSLGLGAGSGLPFSGDAAGSKLAFGVPSFRALAFVRLGPSSN